MTIELDEMLVDLIQEYRELRGHIAAREERCEIIPPGDWEEVAESEALIAQRISDLLPERL